eukprot:2023469-Lingulodinium_polyedra.AAC.1
MKEAKRRGFGQGGSEPRRYGLVLPEAVPLPRLPSQLHGAGLEQADQGIVFRCRPRRLRHRGV